jgi:hypothetical protein
MRLPEKHVLAALAAIGCFACSGGTVPVRQVADAEAAYRAAQTADAERVPQASLHLQLAREQMARAQQLIAAKHYEPAQDALLRAKIDAELASALVQRDTTMRQAKSATAQLSRIRQGTPSQNLPEQNEAPRQEVRP